MRIFLVVMFILSALTAFSQNGKPINSGAVFIDGKYVEPPYIITKSDGNQVFINGISICNKPNSENRQQVSQKPVIPDCLNKFSSFEDINDCYLPGQNLTYVKAASLYFIENYDYEIANDSIIEYYKHLPNIESITQKKGPFYNVKFYNGRILTMYFSADRLRQLYPKNKESEQIEIDGKANLYEIQLSQIQTLLGNNKLMFFFSDESLSNFLISDIDNIEIINNVINGNYSQEVKIESLTGILQNKKLVKKLLNYKEFDLKQLKELSTNSLEQGSNNSICQNNLVRNTSEGTVAFSSKRNKVKAFCPAFYETNTFGMFLTQEFENVKTKIENCGFDNPILYVDYTANDNVFACDYYYLKHMADDAGLIYIAAHGGETEGMLLTRGITEDAIINWIADINDLANIEIANVPDAYKPEEWSDNLECWEAYADSGWAIDNWGTELIENKTITILSICYGFDNGWVNACAGGACFGYEGTTDFGSANAHNDTLLGYMNSSKGNGQFRLASQAYNKVKQSSPTSNFKYIGNGEVTLCPGIISKHPNNLSVVNSSGSGYIALDTWCNSDIDLDVSSYLSPVSFSTQANILISDLEWDNPAGGKSNRIKFSWLNSSSQNSGIVTVYINAEKFQSTPAILNEYHTLNPTVEPTSYSFQVNPYDINMPTISGRVYDASTSEYLTSGTVKDTDNPENSVAINSQEEYSISVNQAWSGSLTATAPGYAPKTQPFNPVFADTEYDFYLSEIPELYISTTNEHPSECPSPNVKYEVEGGSGFWYYTWFLNGTSFSVNQSSDRSVSISQFNLGLNTLLVNISTPDFDLSLIKEILVTEECQLEPINASISQDCSLINVGTMVHFYETSVFPDYWDNYIKRNWIIDEDGNDEIITEKKSINEIDPYNYSCIFNHIGHKIIKLSYWDSDWWDIFNNYNLHICDAWSGVNVIDCDLTSTFFTFPWLNSEMFLGAVYDNWEYYNNTGPIHIYGGSFVFDGAANNHLNGDLPITISACNEIIINGDVEFVTNGDNVLVLEIKKPCNYETNNDKNLIYSDNDSSANSIFENASCYPNPFNDNVNLYFEISTDKVLTVEILDLLGNVYLKNTENYSEGSHLLNIYTKDLAPAAYIIRIFNEDTHDTFKIVKQ